MVNKDNYDNDLDPENECDEEEQEQKARQQTESNLVRVAEREVDTYANIALRYLQQQGSAVIGARGGWCGRAIMVYERMRELGFVAKNGESGIDIGMDTLRVSGAETHISRAGTYRKPYIRITVFGKGSLRDIPVAEERYESDLQTD